MSLNDRRSFLKSTAVTGAAVASAGWLDYRRTYAQGATKFQRIAYRELGSTGYKVSEVGFGAMNTRDPELIHAAIDSGINYIDTAHGYMKGVNEEIVGTVMKTKRDKVFLATKVHCKDKSAKQVREMMELSLKRLQVEYVDIMFMHMPDEPDEVLNQEWIGAFDKAKKDGLFRYAGVSIHTNHVKLLDAAVESKFWEHMLVGYNYKAEQDVTDALHRTRDAGLGIIAMKTQDKGRGYPNHDMGDITINQAALKWVLQNSAVDTTIPGMTSFDQLAENIPVMGMRMSFYENRKLQRYGELDQGKSCRGVTGCTGCLDQCPEGVKICELNRCIGYV
ncbi:MAG: aldo/keto reductase, partial [Candidatus Latescibacteria bacterium]|nr:aldo/keto reductase [Candidatus Latescibacterota bacterium]